MREGGDIGAGAIDREERVGDPPHELNGHVDLLVQRRELLDEAVVEALQEADRRDLAGALGVERPQEELWGSPRSVSALTATLLLVDYSIIKKKIT